jgi:hypothetical protein
MLTDLVDPILVAMERHRARLKLLERHKPSAGQPSPPIDLREESAHICELDIQKSVQPEYERIVEAAQGMDNQLDALANAQKDLAGLVRPRLTQTGNRPDEGYYTIFINGSVDAARAVYANMAQEPGPKTAKKLAAHLTVLGGLAEG